MTDFKQEEQILSWHSFKTGTLVYECPDRHSVEVLFFFVTLPFCHGESPSSLQTHFQAEYLQCWQPKSNKVKVINGREVTLSGLTARQWRRSVVTICIQGLVYTVLCLGMTYIGMITENTWPVLRDTNTDRTWTSEKESLASHHKHTEKKERSMRIPRLSSQTYREQGTLNENAWPLHKDTNIEKTWTGERGSLTFHHKHTQNKQWWKNTWSFFTHKHKENKEWWKNTWSFFKDTNTQQRGVMRKNSWPLPQKT